jgi:hypothetical protein
MRYSARVQGYMAVGFCGFVLVPYESAAQQQDTVVTIARAPMHSGISNVTRTIAIGIKDGAAEYTFAFVKDIAVRDDGAVAVIDNPAGFGLVKGSVRLYDAQGRFVTAIGRDGDGPGEHRGPVAVTFLPDGRLLVLDRLRRQINVYTRTGQHEATWPVPNFNVPGGIGSAFRVDSAGTISVRVGLPAIRVDDFTTIRRSAIVRLRLGGSVIDTLIQPDLPDPAPQLVFRHDRSTATVSAPYSPHAVWQWSPQGHFLTAVTNRYAIDRRIFAAGNTTAARAPGPGYGVHSLRLQIPPAPISAAEHRDQTTFFNRTLDAMQGRRQGSLSAIPRVKPFMRRMFVGNDRRLWVEVRVESERYAPAPRSTRSPVTGQILGPPQERIPWREPVVYDVFEPDGRYVGRVRFPFEFGPWLFQGDDVWGIFRDELDVEYVHRYRVQWNR